MGARSPAGATPLSGAGLPQRYALERPIAQGGMGTVWRASDTVLGRKVALKLLPFSLLEDPVAIQRFSREARAAARVSGHANVATIFDVGETEPSPEDRGGRPYIVMEFLSGGTIRDAISNGEFDQAQALSWIAEAAAALDYAHGQGVIHRDVKPANLLLDGHRVLHVGDFGIARVATEETITHGGQLFGTAAYLSPEQALGHPATAASDRYSLAVVAYELLVGEKPFTAEHFAAQARLHVEADPPPASQRQPFLPAAVDAVLARGMAKAPEDRWPTCAALAQALAGALPEAAAERSPAGGAPQRTRTWRAPMRPARSPERAPVRTARSPGPAPVNTEPLATQAPRRSHRLLALSALGLVILVAVAVAALAGGGGEPASRSSRSQRTSTAASAPAARATATAPSSSATGASGTSAAALEARGHALMVAGQYSQAIPALRQAVQSAAPGSLTYAYALYDLGRSLRLSGDPQAAIPVLRQRLQIPNQTGVVRQELALALQAAGAPGSAGGASAASSHPAATATSGSAPAPHPAGGAPAPPAHGHGKGHAGGKPGKGGPGD